MSRSVVMLPSTKRLHMLDEDKTQSQQQQTFRHIPVVWDYNLSSVLRSIFFSNYLYLWLTHLGWLTVAVQAHSLFVPVQLNRASSFLCTNHRNVSLALKGKVIWQSTASELKCRRHHCQVASSHRQSVKNISI